MLNSHFVKCPQFGCYWSGPLIPNRAVSTSGFPPTGTIVGFQCPCCLRDWRARVIGTKVRTLALGNSEDDPELMVWPPIEIGVGD